MSFHLPLHRHHEVKDRSIDMLHGPLRAKIILFAIPLALSSILQQLFNSADAVVAGRLIDSAALAAVGGVAPVISIFVTLMTGLSIGANVVIAVHIGHGDTHRIRGAIQTIAIVAIACSALFTAAGIAATDAILTAISMPGEAWDEAVQYLHVYFAGFAAFLVYNFGSAILRARGDTRRPLYALACGAALNIVLDYIAVAWLETGVTGIALATVISNALSAGIIVCFLVRETGEFRLDLNRLHVVGSDIQKLLYIGVPAGLQGVVFALSNVVVQSAINSFGSSAIAGNAAAMNYEYYTYFIVNAFGQAAVTFVGQNYAARKLDRCDRIVRFCMAASIGIAGCVSVVCVVFGNQALAVFTTDAVAVGFGLTRLWIIELLECLPSSYEITAGAMRGMGWSVLPTVIVIVGSCVLRILYVSFLFPTAHNFTQLMLLYPFTWVVTGASMLILFFIARRRSYAKS